MALAREHLFTYVQCEPKDKSKLVKETVAKIVRLEASQIGGKLAREVKAGHINNLQAVIYWVS